MSPGLRVCYLLKRFPRLSQTFVLNEMLQLERQGVEIDVVSLRPSGEAVAHPRTQELRAPVHYVGPDWSESDIAELISSRGADHIHAHFATDAAEAAARVSALTGIPFSFTAHATDIYRRGIDRRALAHRIAAAAFVVTVTEANRRHLDAVLRAEGLAGSVVRLYNGLDLRAIRPPGHLRESGLIVAVGRLVEKKGFADLIDACERVRTLGRVRCAIVGEGELRADLDERVAAAGLRGVVSLEGALTHDRVLDLIGRASVFVLPCVVAADGDMDALPTVLLEAMALGTPVISTRISGIPEIVEHGESGLLVDQRDPAALARAIGRALGSPALGRRLRTGGLARVRQRFDIEKNVGELLGLMATRVAA